MTYVGVSTTKIYSWQKFLERADISPKKKPAEAGLDSKLLSRRLNTF